MKKTIAKIRRILSDGHRQELGEFPFLDGEYFNLYHGLVSSSGFAESSFMPWLGFKVQVKEDSVVIKKLLPPEEKECLASAGQTCAFDFNGVGKYEIQIISID